MIERRRFQRIRCASKCILTFNAASYEGKLENISLSGALASFTGSILIRPGNTGMLDIHLDGQAAPLRFDVEVVHSGFSMVGVKFIGIDPDARERLQELLRSLTRE